MKQIRYFLYLLYNWFDSPIEFLGGARVLCNVFPYSNSPFLIASMGRRPDITEAERGHYLTNKQMLEEWHKCKELGEITPRFALSLKLLSERAARRYGNNNWYEDNVSNGLLRMLENWDKFDPEKSQNPFAYFTQIAKMEYIKLWYKNRNYVHIDLLIVTGEFKDNQR